MFPMSKTRLFGLKLKKNTQKLTVQNEGSISMCGWITGDTRTLSNYKLFANLIISVLPQQKHDV